MPSCSGQFASVLLHSLGARQVAIGTARLLCAARAWAFRLSANHGAASLKFHHPSEQLPHVERDALREQPGRKVADAGDGQMAAEDHAVKAFENPIDFRAMFGDKRVHGVAPAYWDTVWDVAGTTPFYLIRARGRSGHGLEMHPADRIWGGGGNREEGRGWGVPGGGNWGRWSRPPQPRPACGSPTLPEASRREPQLALDEPFGCGEAAVGVGRVSAVAHVLARQAAIRVVRITHDRVTVAVRDASQAAQTVVLVIELVTELIGARCPLACDVVRELEVNAARVGDLGQPVVGVIGVQRRARGVDRRDQIAVGIISRCSASRRGMSLR